MIKEKDQSDLERGNGDEKKGKEAEKYFKGGGGLSRESKSESDTSAKHTHNSKAPSPKTPLPPLPPPGFLLFILTVAWS